MGTGQPGPEKSGPLPIPVQTGQKFNIFHSGQGRAQIESEIEFRRYKLLS